MKLRAVLLSILAVCVLYLAFLTFNPLVPQYNHFLGAIWGSNFPQYPPREVTAESSVVDNSIQVVISWKAPESTSGIVGYKVYRCEGSYACGPSMTIGSTISLSYTDRSVLSSATYNYAVAAYNSSGLNSPMSNIASVVAKSMWDIETETSIQPLEQEQIQEAPEAENGTQETVSGEPVFTKTLYFGLKDEEVTRLQTFLAADPLLYPEGLVTGYYGSLTVVAVGRFQLKYNIVVGSYSPGYGIVGPKTREKLNELYGG